MIEIHDIEQKIEISKNRALIDIQSKNDLPNKIP